MIIQIFSIIGIFVVLLSIVIFIIWLFSNQFKDDEKANGTQTILLVILLIIVASFLFEAYLKR